ncbi:hypothetical protein [Commensalibacter oyaizuii]|uniref:DUF1963 domain-containing protein n=1 Tax=Commensalibacter oyaizuii TaxID=3043873 RepID=A0ABT6PYH7_9PROT|nr:hypothetical protein [Commensalibacter sp. TBRC 16381]MDI2089915.1 hypothetical protein [Commensalibacter sp. TBRC 16381]
MPDCLIPKVIEKLYPDVTEVFVNPELLRPYFFPLLSFKHDGQLFHMIAVPGLFFNETQCQHYSECGFFGFQRDQDGRYEFLGGFSIFEEYQEVPALYKILQEDWLLHGEKYYHQHITVKDYISSLDIQDNLKKKLKCYIGDFYGYQMTKTNWYRTGKFKTFMFMTEAWSNVDALDFINANEHDQAGDFLVNKDFILKFDYDLTPEMMIGGIGKGDFLSVINGGTNFLFWDDVKDIIYLVELYS